LFKHLGIALVALALSGVPKALAQEEPEDTSSNEVEEMYDKGDAADAAKSAPKADAKREQKEQVEEKKVQTLSDLATLAPFSDVSVIQRKFLPKTGRFEFSGSGFTNLNNPFFTNIGLGLRAAYYFREQYAVEGILNVAATGSRQVTDDLEKKRGITTDNLVGTRGFAGLAFKWNPIYGKMTWLNHRIVPFDINFNLGGGLTRTTEDENEPTLHLGTSQVFALSKGMALRWDLTWNMFQATTTDSKGKKDTLSQNDLFLGFGVSFYFPEASYR
jgi:outer membrane beta-barrel protein